MQIQTNINNKKYFKEYLQNLLVLAIPLFMGSLGHTLIGATDVLVVARYNINSLAAISIANSIIFTIFIFGIGITTAISILLSNYRGGKKRIKKYLSTTLLLCLILSIVFSVICYFSKFLIPYIGFEEHLCKNIIQYIEIVSVSMFGIFFFEGIKQFLQAYEIVKFPNMIILLSVVLNFVLDVIFVFGYGSIPAMGSKGAAIATLSTRMITAIIMLVYIYKFINWKSQIDLSLILKYIKIGLPIGFALVLEFLAFNIISVLIGKEAAILAAVHSILITISSATFMIPFALATALSIKVAYYFGAMEPIEIKKYSYTALVYGVGFMAIAAVLLLLFPIQIIGFFTKDVNVIKIAIPLISIVATYQIFDGIQTITGGVLKGFKMTKTVSTCVFVGYWLFGAPIAYYAVYKYNLSLKGFWIALSASICLIGIIQLAIARYRYKLLIKNNK